MASEVLVSFIGTGGRAEGGKKKEYERTDYLFPNGEKKNTALITSALFDFIKPDKLIVIGTAESVWCELIEILPEEKQSSEYEKIFEEVWESKVSLSTLKIWEDFLSNELKSKVSLRLVDSSATTEIIEILYKEIPNSSNLYLDITHLFRHFPLMASFLVPILRYIKNLERVSIVYGKLKKNAPSQIVFLDEANKLVDLLEAVALVKHTGNFEKFSKILNLKDLERLYLRMETNREINEYEVGALSKKIESCSKGNIYEVISSSVLKEEVLPYLQARCVEERMATRALFFAERKQFVKAYTLMAEAITNLAIRAYNIPTDENNLFSKIMGILPEEFKETFRKIKLTRNAIAHASSDIREDIAKILSSERELINWIKRGIVLVDFLLTKEQEGETTDA